MQGRVTGSKVMVIFGKVKVKVKVTRVKGQIMVRSPSNLVGGAIFWILFPLVITDFKYLIYLCKGQGQVHWGQRSK